MTQPVVNVKQEKAESLEKVENLEKAENLEKYDAINNIFLYKKLYKDIHL